VSSSAFAVSPAAEWTERFRALESLASETEPASRRSYLLADRTLELRAASRDVADWFGFPLRHVAAPPGNGPRLDIQLGQGDPVDLEDVWRATQERTLGTRGRPRLLIGDGTTVLGGVWPDVGLLGLLHRPAGKAVLWVRHLQAVPASDATTLLRGLVTWWLTGSDYWVAHAAAVGGSRGAALLAGRAGSGKSGTAVACFEAGLSYLGDDAILCRSGNAEVFSLSSCAHLFSEDVGRHHPSLSAAPRSPDAAKVFVDLASVEPGRIATRAPLCAVVRLTIHGGAAGRLRQVEPARVFTALAPSSLLNVPGVDRSALSGMAELVRRVPAYELTLPEDRREAARLLRGLLEDGDRQ
jgi:hypothetical protein